MAFELNPVAVTAAPLLRAVAAEGWVTKTDLAEIAGRHRNHIARDIGVLERAGLVMTSADIASSDRPYLLTDEGIAQLAALDRAGDPNAAGALTALHSDLEPHPLNPRKDFETAEAEEALDELRVSIVKSGLLQPIVVRPKAEAGKWWIIAGERRWRAIGQAISDGDWDDDKPIEVTAREVDDRDHLLLALNENLQRSNMSAIEEGVAFGAAVNDFNLSTEELANRTGKSQRYVQQRIALLKLDQVDQDRMRLPKDHPDRLSFKAARTMTQTPREAPLMIGNPWDHGGYGEAVTARLQSTYGFEAAEAITNLTDQIEDAYRLGLTIDGCIFEIESRNGLHALPTQDEPGSLPRSEPAPEPPFGANLTDHEALLLVEIADKSERDPDAELGSEGYTRVQAVPVAGAAASLVARNIIGFRQRGAVAFVTPRLHGSGAKAWLEDIGFYAHRDDVLFEFRTRVLGSRAIDLVQQYATPWLNPADPAAAQPSALPKSPTSPQADAEPTQPELIEETPDERAAREQRQAEAEAQAATQAVADAHSRRIAEWMNFARFRREGGIAADATDYLTTGEPFSPEDLAVALYRALAKGALTEAGVILAVLQKRGDQVARPTLEQMPAALIGEVIEAARAPVAEEVDD